MNNKTYIRNTAVLFAAMAVTKIVGAIFKIPLANVLGGTGMGYFSAAYGLYSPVFAVTAAGIPTVLMRRTAQNIATGRCRNAEKTKHTALLIFSLIGTAGMLIIWLLSGFFADNIACSPQSHTAIIFIAPAVLFCCIASVYRGYYEGNLNVIPTAMANVTEAVSRAVIGLALSYGMLMYAKYCYNNGLAFLGTEYNTYNEVYEAALPIAAAGAILAVTLSEVCGLIALLIHDKRSCKKTSDLGSDNTVDRTRDIISSLMRDILPIAVFALVMNCFSFIDLITVTRTLELSLVEDQAFYDRAFRDVFASGISRDEFANFAYGSYTGIAMSLFMIIPSFAGMTEKTSIPEIASAWEKKNSQLISERINTLFKAAALIGCPACFGAAVLAEPILSMLYADRAAEISVCSESFMILCAGGLFMVFASALSGIFQAIGRADIPLWLMGGAVVIKAVLNPLLISIPQLNISGAALATVAGYIFASAAGMVLLKKNKIHISLLRSTFHIVICGTACAFAAGMVYSMLSGRLIQPFVTVVSVFTGGLVYVILLITMGVFRTSPIIKSENQKKYRKGLEKSAKIG